MCAASERLSPSAAEQFTDTLLSAGLLVDTGVPGVFGKHGDFEAVIAGLDRMVEVAGQDLRADVFRFPPVIPRQLLERSEYLGAFPQLIGSVHSFAGDDDAHASLLHAVEQGTDWTGAFAPTQVVLTPAACYPVYGMLAGTLPDDGRTIDVMSYCFRHEPSRDTARMQSFRMHEFVRLGSADACVQFRDNWLERGTTLLQSLGLDTSVVPANDPFFGRRGRLLAKTQREQSLKFEIVVPITSTEKPTAIASSNWHQDHFGELFGIRQADGSLANTACVGFGLERITLALLMTHGVAISAWPSTVRGLLHL